MSRNQQAPELLSIFSRLLETNNPAEFTEKFTGKNREVLPFIFSIDKFVKINGLEDTNVRFRRIFNTMDPHFQDLFIEDQDENAELTIELLTTWLIERFPPPPMKHEWVSKLKSIIMRNNEDPALVWNKFETILKRVNKAIEYINKGRSDDTKMKKVSKEQKVDALQAIFIRNNNCSKYSNEGAINKRVVNRLMNQNPVTYQNWVDFMKDIKDVIPSSFRSLKRFQFISYPTNTSDYDIYRTVKQKKDKIEDKITKKESGRKRKRKQTFDDKRKRRKYNEYCTRCGRNNHHESNCRATHDVFGKSLRKITDNSNNNSNNGSNKPASNNKHCDRCTRNNHWTKDCKARYYPDRKPINDDKFSQKSYQTNKNKGKPDSKRIDKVPTKDLMALLSKRITTNDKLNTDQQYKCLALLNNIDENMSARQDE